MDLAPSAAWRLDEPVGQLRAAPMRCGGEDRLLLVHARDAAIDPSPDMFFLPRSTLRLSCVCLRAGLVWSQDLGPGIVPGPWFCPVLPFDLDGDGEDEIFCVATRRPEHPLDGRALEIERRCPRSGAVTGRWPWAHHDTHELPAYAMHRRFLAGGSVGGRPVLVSGEGTYVAMSLRARHPDMRVRWSWDFDRRRGGTGPAGAHSCAVVDLDGDGDDELLWGERVIGLADGRERLVYDGDRYRGHSDVVQPLRWRDGWRIYTCRESHDDAAPRVACFEADGSLAWGDLERGHIDQGWAARCGADGELLAWALRIGGKEAGPAGTNRLRCEEFLYDLASGRRLEMPVSCLGGVPIDLDGSGRQLVLRGLDGGDGGVWDIARGRRLGAVPGRLAAAGRLLPIGGGEQALVARDGGRVELWADRAAVAAASARERWADPAYRAGLRLGAVGYHQCIVAGL